MSSLLDSLDFYCERLDSSFWAEPLNAITNLSFFIAAIACYISLRRYPPEKHRSYFYCLVLFIFLTALGSFSFHTFAKRWSHWADILPIFFFMLLAMWFFLKNIFNTSTAISVASMTIFLILTVAGAFPPLNQPINGSLMYMPSIFLLYVFSFWLMQRGEAHNSIRVFAIAIVFTFSLVARTLDKDLCELFTTGTHFVWHLLNGLVTYLIVQLFLKAQHGEAE